MNICLYIYICRHCLDTFDYEYTEQIDYVYIYFCFEIEVETTWDSCK